VRALIDRRGDGVGAVGPNEAGRTGTHRFISSGDVDWFRELGRQLLGPELDAAEKAPWAD
jgi:hypothetical protein